MATEAPTIEEVKQLQAGLGLRDTHVVWLGETGFVIAHTDEERASGMDLTDCDVHYLAGFQRLVVGLGYFKAFVKNGSIFFTELEV